MIIGGLEKFSLIDYPGHLSAIVFTQGCNFRCHFCYNPMLVVLPSSKAPDRLQNNRHERSSEKDYSPISEDSLFLFLDSRIGKLEGVVISGGEPTLHKDLPEFIKKIKDQGFKVKLDTNGTNPKMLHSLLIDNRLDYVAMDIKAPEKNYQKAVAVDVDLQAIKESIDIIKKSGVPYEFRTTLVPGIHEMKDIAMMGELIKGADKWYLQKFEGNTRLINEKFEGVKPHTEKELEEMKKIGLKYVKFCDFR